MKKQYFIFALSLLCLISCQPDNPQPNTSNNGSDSGYTIDSTSTGNSGSGSTTDTTSTGNSGSGSTTDTTSTGNSGGGTYPQGTVHCLVTPTAVVDVTNPTTGKTWMDRNLGASQAAASSVDLSSYGDLYQWGRGADGHQCRNSSTRSYLSFSDQPGHGDFIIFLSGNWHSDWRSSPNDNLWQGVNGINNPCPSGYRLPTSAELDAERASWISKNVSGAFASPLRFIPAGSRSGDNANASLNSVGTTGNYWSSTVYGSNISYLYIPNDGLLGYNNEIIYASIRYSIRLSGLSVRCLKD